MAAWPIPVGRLRDQSRLQLVVFRCSSSPRDDNSSFRHCRPHPAPLRCAHRRPQRGRIDDTEWTQDRCRHTDLHHDGDPRRLRVRCGLYEPNHPSSGRIAPTCRCAICGTHRGQAQREAAGAVARREAHVRPQCPDGYTARSRHGESQTETRAMREALSLIFSSAPQAARRDER